MLVGEVGIALSEQNSAVFVSEPTAGGEDVEAAHDGAAGEESAEVVKTEIGQIRSGAGEQEGLTKRARPIIALPALW